MAWRIAALALALAGTTLLTPAQASLIGQAFTASYRFPTLGAVYAQASWSPAGFAVGAGQETVGNVEGVTNIAVDFDAASLVLVLTTTLNVPTWNAAGFNGPVFTAALPHGLLGASVDAGGTTMAGFDSSRVTLTADEIRVNWNGLAYVDGTRISIAFAVPEPGTLGILGFALLALGAVAWRVRRARARSVTPPA